MMTDFSAATDKDKFSEEAWVEVMQSIDKTYQELVEHQSVIEARNAELEGMRAFLTSILGSMSDVLIVCGRDGQILEVDSAFVELTGAVRESVIGTPVASVFASDERDAIRADLRKLETGAVIEASERNLATPKGDTPLELSVAARRDKRGRFNGAVLIGRPVGELRSAYKEITESHEALKEAQSQLVHSEKLASLGRLLAGVAHELNNPISFVYGNAHSLERYAQKFETYFERVEAGASREELVALRGEMKLDRAVRNLRSAVSGALEGAERVRDIVESLRRLSAEGAGQIEPFDLAETSRTAAHWVIKGRASAVDVTVDTSGPVIALGRPGHIQQVVMNLVQNALDAMEGGEAPALRMRVWAEGGRGLLEVADNGPGVDEAIAMHVFDPFFTTKPVGQGTGLGLSISFKIVEENNGALTFRNRDEGGAAFRLSLPVEVRDD